MASLREEAEYFRLGLILKLLDNDAIVDWADRTISKSDDPPIEIIEIALAGKMPLEEMTSLLKSVPGQGDLSVGAHQTLRLLRDQLGAGTITLESAVNTLWAYHQCAFVEEAEKSQAVSFSNLLYMAQEGEGGTLESVQEEVLSFLTGQTLQLPLT